MIIKKFIFGLLKILCILVCIDVNGVNVDIDGDNIISLFDTAVFIKYTLV